MLKLYSRRIKFFISLKQTQVVQAFNNETIKKLAQWFQQKLNRIKWCINLDFTTFTKYSMVHYKDYQNRPSVVKVIELRPTWPNLYSYFGRPDPWASVRCAAPWQDCWHVRADSAELVWCLLLLVRDVKLQITSYGLWASLCLELVSGFGARGSHWDQSVWPFI